MSANFEEEKYAIDVAGDAEASFTFPAQASSLRKGGFAMLKNCPCKITELSTSKPGKHGHAKCNITGRDIFTGKDMEVSTPASHNMDVPIVKRAEYEVMYISGDGYLQLLRPDGTTKADVKVPDNEVGEKIKALIEEAEKVVVVVILAAMGKELAVEVKATDMD